ESSSFISNTTTQFNTGGGAIYDQGHLGLGFSTLSDNQADDGGAVYVDSGATAVIVFSELSGNRARYGGAIDMQGVNLTLSSSHLGHNAAETVGGALYNRAPNASIRYLSLEGSTATEGGPLGNDLGGGVSIC